MKQLYAVSRCFCALSDEYTMLEDSEILDILGDAVPAYSSGRSVELEF